MADTGTPTSEKINEKVTGGDPPIVFTVSCLGVSQTSSFVCAGVLAASDSFERTRSTAAA